MGASTGWSAPCRSRPGRRPGVHISLVSPGGVNTPIYTRRAATPATPGTRRRRCASPESVARDVVQALDEPSGTGTWASRTGSWWLGFRLLPGVFDAARRTDDAPARTGAGIGRAASGQRVRAGSGAGGGSRPLAEDLGLKTWLTTPTTRWSIGAGPNGLVAANQLLDAGWSVLVLEAQPDVGGAVRSDREVHPDFVHDTFSAFYPLAAASPTIRSFRLEEHGLRWRHAPAVLGHPRPDGSWALLHRDREVTAAPDGRRTHAGDGDGVARRCAPSGTGSARTSSAPCSRRSRRSAHGLAAAGAAALASAASTSSARCSPRPPSSGASRFGGEAPRLLLAGNAGHADIPLDAAGLRA